MRLAHAGTVKPGVLRFLARVTQTTAGSGVDLGICGEMGGRRLEALALMGLGFRRFSITPVAVGPIKELVRKVDLSAIGAVMKRLLATPGANIRTELQAWAEAQGIDTE